MATAVMLPDSETGILHARVYDGCGEFGDHTHTFICTVVNNQAARIARSRVFANILVNDISADRHFLP